MNWSTVFVVVTKETAFPKDSELEMPDIFELKGNESVTWWDIMINCLEESEIDSMLFQQLECLLYYYFFFLTTFWLSISMCRNMFSFCFTHKSITTVSLHK